MLFHQLAKMHRRRSEKPFILAPKHSILSWWYDRFDTGWGEWLFYDFSDFELLAYHVCEIFVDDILADSLSKASVEYAEHIHNRQKNTQDFVNMYEDILTLES